jgi:glycosyltransferase involved in cell wall biosynthesis
LGVEKKVKVLLNISRKRQRDILQHSKIYLHPQVPYESFGISVVEAMFAGCIPVVPDIGGLREIVPREQRYASLEEAAALVDESVSDWSQRRIQECVAMAGRFSQARFIEQFLEIMRLQP